MVFALFLFASLCVFLTATFEKIKKTSLAHLSIYVGYYEEVLAATRHNHSTCWIVTQSIEDKRARTLATTHKCQLITNPSQYTDYTLLQAAPKTLVMGVSTFIYFPAFLGAATEVRVGVIWRMFGMLVLVHLKHCFVQFLRFSAVSF
jgi:hypothetical protein